MNKKREEHNKICAEDKLSKNGNNSKRKKKLKN